MTAILRKLRGSLRVFCASDAAQIVELAVCLPLLAVLFVTTYDFGQAFTLKQKMIAATREAARFASDQPTSDLASSSGTCSAPASVCSVRDVIHNYFVANNVNDCGLGTKAANSPVSWSWEFDASTACGGSTFKLIIDRAYIFPPQVVGSVTLEATQVTVIYPYHWQFNRAIQVLIPGSSYAAVTPITTTAAMQNLN